MVIVASLACGCTAETIDSNAPAVLATIGDAVDLDAGIDGHLGQFVSTSFQTGVWQTGFFAKYAAEAQPDASALFALAAQNVHVQLYDSPLVGGDSFETGQWDFSELDAIVQPLLRLEGQSPPMIQITRSSTPAWISLSDWPVFAQFCASIVSYYNADSGLALPDGGRLASDAGRPIQWWGILDDTNDNGTSSEQGTDYASLYAQATASMLAVDPRIRFSATEFNACLSATDPLCSETAFIPPFLIASASAAGGPAPIDALSLHMYSTTTPFSPTDPTLRDELMFSTVGQFAQDVVVARQALVDGGYPDAQVWITQNNINAASVQVSGTDAEGFVADPRGTSAFFAAWRPTVFSRLGKAGNQGLFQWQYTGGQCPDASLCNTDPHADTDPQNAEVNYETDQKYPSYWVDAWLGRMFPSPPGQDILQVTTDPSDADGGGADGIEVLATRQSDRARVRVVVMVANHAVSDPGDINGPGAKRNVVIDVSRVLAGGGAWSATEVVIDASTNVVDGPAETAVSLAAGWVALTFDGYGVAFLKLDAAQPSSAAPYGR
jgi:hypothetical protein